jgi:Tfp pilus assembly protein PilW
VTIVEIAVGLAVGALMVAGILVLIEQSQKAYMHSSEVTDLQQNVRVSIDRIVRVIQAGGVNPLNRQWGGATANDVAFTAFREAGRNCLRVYADLNGDGFVTGVDENVYFHWPTTPATGSPLRETRGTAAGQPDAGQPWVTLATGPDELARDIVANPPSLPLPLSTDMFRYFTGINDPLGAPNTELAPPALSTTACASLTDAQRARVARVVVTVTGQATIAGVVLKKTVTSDARARNVP